MKFAILGVDGTIAQACNDDTVTTLPDGTLSMTDEQFANWPAYRRSEDGLSLVWVPPMPPSQGELDEQKRQAGQAAIEVLERKYQMPKMLRVTIMQLAEREAIAAGAVLPVNEGGPLDAAQSLAVLRADTNSGYYAVRQLHQQIDIIRIEAGL